MSEEAKNQISHRARAYQALHRRLGKRATDAEHAAEGDAPDA